VAIKIYLFNVILKILLELLNCVAHNLCLHFCFKKVQKVQRDILYRIFYYITPLLGGKLNAKLWTQELEVRGRGDFKHVAVDGKYVKFRGGRKGVLPIALGLTEDGVKPCWTWS
jgi:hypothetical protein